ncbi:Crp/Fnr family transcriptional regulator [Paenibacillus rigui]|uniref:cAMP-binding protein n=1 Tax=Paenibacillus rigui TaxID=554312 RepID=A0A229UQA8_9BACL|nr:Crp/Fnr family transcriptional regulator [Paenibacillus rigui]OXM85612.1 cAMP-binding protein [Paenibacillus rigui]
MRSQQIEHIVSKFPSLSSISREDWEGNGIAVLSLPPNEVLHEGHLLEHAALILDGTVRVYKVSGTGREVTLYRISGGECCPLMISSILGETEYEASACIEVPSSVLILPIAVFRDWIDKDKSFRQYIFKVFARRLLVMSNLLDSIHFKSIRARIAEYLLVQTAVHHNSVVITHEQLAVELGSAREVISRTLKSLEQEGWIRLSRGQITVIHKDPLLLITQNE